MAFVVQLTDNIETANLIDGTNFDIMDGGFDIGTPQKDTQTFTVLRAGPFFAPTNAKYTHRQATVRLHVKGSTRSAVIAQFNKLERILRAAEARIEIPRGRTQRRVQLQYQWDGASGATFFEVIAGDITLPGDVLSVEKMFATDNSGDFFVANVTINLRLSPYGYGLSLYSTPTAELELANASSPTPATGGKDVRNTFKPAGAEYSNYVEIADTELPGGQPYIMYMTAESAGADHTTSFQQMFIGHRVTPFPTKIRFEGEDRTGGAASGGSGDVPDSAASGQYYRDWARTTAADTPYYSDIFAEHTFALDGEDTFGVFFAFIQGFTHQYAIDTHYAIGAYDYVSNGYRYISDHVTPRVATRHLPIGTIRFPVPGLEYATLSDHDTVSLGLFIAQEEGITRDYDLDSINLLPMDQGLRVWANRGVDSDAMEGVLHDDAWRGLQYCIREADGNMSTPFLPLQAPIMLEPNLDQRLYFESVSNGSHDDDVSRIHNVRIYVVPMYKTLAL